MAVATLPSVRRHRPPPAMPQVLVIRGWPGGFCPLHCCTDRACNSECWITRIQFAEAARGLEAYFQSSIYTGRPL